MFLWVINISKLYINYIEESENNKYKLGIIINAFNNIYINNGGLFSIIFIDELKYQKEIRGMRRR